MSEPSRSYAQQGIELHRLHLGSRYGPFTERMPDGSEELAFYGSSVAEGICPDLHDENDLVDDGSRDRRPRRLTLGSDGWLHCEDGCAPWKFVSLAGSDMGK